MECDGVFCVSYIINIKSRLNKYLGKVESLTCSRKQNIYTFYYSTIDSKNYRGKYLIYISD